MAAVTDTNVYEPHQWKHSTIVAGVEWKNPVGTASGTFQLAACRWFYDVSQMGAICTKGVSPEPWQGNPGPRTAETPAGMVNSVGLQNPGVDHYLVDELHTAINGDKRIRFHYTGYDGHGRRVLRRGGAWYDVSPYALLWDDENYYLIGYDSAFSEIRHFRVDKISDLCTAGDGREGGKAFAALDMSAYTSAHFGMFSGTPENIRLECRDTLAGAVIDRFGTDTMLIPSREGYFTVTVPVAVSAPFFGWLCSFGGDIKLLAPESAVDALREHLRKFAEAYQI